MQRLKQFPENVRTAAYFITIYDNIFSLNYCVCFDNIKVLVYTQSYGGQVVVLALGTQSKPNSEERSEQKCEQIWQVP